CDVILSKSRANVSMAVLATTLVVGVTEVAISGTLWRYAIASLHACLATAITVRLTTATILSTGSRRADALPTVLATAVAIRVTADAILNAGRRADALHAVLATAVAINVTAEAKLAASG